MIIIHEREWTKVYLENAHACDRSHTSIKHSTATGRDHRIGRGRLMGWMDPTRRLLLLLLLLRNVFRAVLRICIDLRTPLVVPSSASFLPSRDPSLPPSLPRCWRWRLSSLLIPAIYLPPPPPTPPPRLRCYHLDGQECTVCPTPEHGGGGGSSSSNMANKAALGIDRKEGRGRERK